MRFKANLHSPQVLFGICQALEKIQKCCILKLNSETIRFIVITDLTDGTQVWSGVETEALFNNFNISSVLNDDIYLEFEVSNLLRALRTSSSASSIETKLVKRNGQAHLAMIIKIQGNAQNIAVRQEVPLRMVNLSEVQSLHEPMAPTPDIQICLPLLSDLKSIVDRMKSLSDNINISGDSSRTLQFSVDTPQTTVRTFFKDMPLRLIEGQDMSTASGSATISIKKLSKFLHSSHVHPEDVCCSIVSNRMLIITVVSDHLYMTYYLPATT